MGGWSGIRFRSFKAPTAPAASGDSGSQPGQIRYRPGNNPSAALPVPGSGGSSGPIGIPVGAPRTLGLWMFDDPGFDNLAYKDLSWRWLHHQPTLEEDAGNHGTIEPGAGIGTAFDGTPSGTSATRPYIDLAYIPSQYGSGNTIVDTQTTSVWTIAIYWDNPVAPSMHSSSPVAPFPGTTPPVPIFGRLYTNSFIIGYQWSYTWSGIPGSWDADFTLQPFISVGGGGGTTVTTPVAGPPATIIEFDFPNRKITPNIGPAAGVSIPWVWPATYWPDSDQVWGGGNMGPYYWSNYQHPHATIQACLIYGDTLATTVDLINNTTIAPSHGPKSMHGVRFRSSSKASAPVGSRLNEYAHYWPLNDPSPGPMVDVIAGARLLVQNPSLAQFNFSYDDDPISDLTGRPEGSDDDSDDRPGLRLTTPSSTSWVYLTRDTGHPATIGTGGVGHDFTITLWLVWEGQQLSNVGPTFPLLVSQSVLFGATNETAVSLYIGKALAEPIGVSFDTWGSATHTIDRCSTAGFDWPANTDPNELVSVTKIPGWALAAFVYRTDPVAHTVTKEIWVDGVMVASAAADPAGWGASVDIAYVGGTAPGVVSGFGTGTQGVFRDLSYFPFSLSPDELAFAPLA